MITAISIVVVLLLLLGISGFVAVRKISGIVQGSKLPPMAEGETI